MKIVAMSFIFLCSVNLIQSQSEVNSETNEMGDSGWWSRRITKINRIGEQRIGLASKDNQRDDVRWKEETVIRDSRRRPRPFASALPSNAGIQFQDRFESQREKFRNVKKPQRSFAVAEDFNVSPVPSPILLPPFATPSPVYRINILEKNATTPKWNNESSLNGGKSSTTSALEQIRIYEITTLNSTNKAAIESEPSYANESFKSSNDNNQTSRWTNFFQNKYVNETEQRNNDVSDERSEIQNNPGSFYIDEKTKNEKTRSFVAPTNRSNLIKSPRGNRKYQDDIIDEKGFMRKRTFSGLGRYDWQRRSGQRTRQFKFSDDTNTEVGSVPGVPGRDYPIHQEHTHHHLRNVADRFPCPQTPKTHVYLADRASRCQIFYVCYGSKTGVPMVCPNGTLFSETLQVCDWWYNVAC